MILVVASGWWLKAQWHKLSREVLQETRYGLIHEWISGLVESYRKGQRLPDAVPDPEEEVVS